MSDQVFVIAEAGVNHNGDMVLARRLIEAAGQAGADAVKFQTFRADLVVTGSASKADYQTRLTGSDESQLDMLKQLELSRQDHIDLKACCDNHGIQFLSTPFDAGSASFLADEIGVSHLKLPSGEITNGPFLLHVARLGLPIILSTGMSTFDEVAIALGVLAHGFGDAENLPEVDRSVERGGFEHMGDRITLLHCTSEYPAPFAEVNLRVLPEMAERFLLPVGLSDHTPGHAAALGAVALGASVIEKHITLDRTMAGPDHAASLEPPGFAELVANVRSLEAALGSPQKQAQASELANRDVARRSLVALRPIEAGDEFSAENLGAKRPGTGLSPMRYWQLIGSRAHRAYETDELIDLTEDAN